MTMHGLQALLYVIAVILFFIAAALESGRVLYLALGFTVLAYSLPTIAGAFK